MILAMSHVIPIHTSRGCGPMPTLSVVAPQLQGPPQAVQAILGALAPRVDAEFGATVPLGAWLRRLQLERGEAVLTLAPGLTQHGHAIGAHAFDVLRRLLPDTDLYVGVEPAATAR